MGEISQGVVFDGGTITVGAPEEVGHVRFVFVLTGDSGYMHALALSVHARNYRGTSAACQEEYLFFTGYTR